MNKKEWLDISLINTISHRLGALAQTVAVAESVSSGLLQYSFSRMPHAQRFFQGGITAYNLAQKTRHLRVDPVHALACNCVSEKVAIEMASQVSFMFNADWGIGITGYATPERESGEEVFAWFAIAFKGRLLEAGKINCPIPEPPVSQQNFVKEILRHFAGLLDSLPAD